MPKPEKKEKILSTRVTQTAFDLLVALADMESRSQSSMLEHLIKEAAKKASIKPDKK